MRPERIGRGTNGQALEHHLGHRPAIAARGIDPDREVADQPDRHACGLGAPLDLVDPGAGEPLGKAMEQHLVSVLRGKPGDSVAARIAQFGGPVRPALLAERTEMAVERIEQRVAAHAVILLREVPFDPGALVVRETGPDLAQMAQPRRERARPVNQGPGLARRQGWQAEQGRVTHRGVEKGAARRGIGAETLAVPRKQRVKRVDRHCVRPERSQRFGCKGEVAKVAERALDRAAQCRDLYGGSPRSAGAGEGQRAFRRGDRQPGAVAVEFEVVVTRLARRERHTILDRQVKAAPVRAGHGCAGTGQGQGDRPAGIGHHQRRQVVPLCLEPGQAGSDQALCICGDPERVEHPAQLRIRYDCLVPGNVTPHALHPGSGGELVQRVDSRVHRSMLGAAPAALHP